MSVASTQPLWLDGMYRDSFTFYVLAVNVKIKGKVHAITGHERPEVEEIYSSTHSLTSALCGGGWSTPRHGPFTPGKDPVPIV